MHISITTEKKMFEVGEEFPHENVITDGVLDPVLILGPGENNPEGEEVLLTGITYNINNKRYDLSSGYAVKAIVCDGILVPKLRKATMGERYAFIKKIPQLYKEDIVEGDVNEYWPIIQKL